MFANHTLAHLVRPLALLIGLSIGAGAVAQPASLNTENELLLELRLDGQPQGLDILGYQRGDQFLLSLQELASGLGFAITVDGPNGMASGSFISPERRFDLSYRRGDVLSDGQRFPLSARDVAVFQNDIYVDTEALQRWFPLRLSAVVRELYLDVQPEEQLPVQARQERRQRGKRSQSTSLAPQHPLQDTPYRFVGPRLTSLRLGYSTLRQTPESDAQYAGNYALLSRGDLAWMSSILTLSGDTDDSVAGAALTLERTKFKGPLSLNHVEIGDINGGSRGILLRGGGVRGALNGRFADESINIEGSQLPDWDVELYQNGQLIETLTTGADGRYFFEAVPLLLGENHFELKFYGPNGERESREEFHYLGEDMLRPGRISYELAAMQSGRSVFGIQEPGTDGDRDSGIYTADFNLGLSRNFSLGAGVRSVLKDDERLNYTNAGLGIASRYFYGSVRAHQAPDAQDSMSASLRTSFANTRLNLNYTTYEDDPDLESSELQWRASLRLRSTLLGAVVNLDANNEEQENLSIQRAALGTTIPLSRRGRFSTSVSTEQRETREEDIITKTRTTAGQSAFHLAMSPWNFRVGANYRFEPDAEMVDYSADGNLRIDRDLSLNLNLRHSQATDITYYRGGINWLLKSGTLSAQVSYDSNERWAGLITFSTTLVPRPNRWLPGFDSRTSVNSGVVLARVTADDDQTGELDLSGIEVEAVQAWRKATTNRRGDAMLVNIPPHRHVDIQVKEGSITDTELNSTNPGVSIITHPGSYAEVEFPLVRSTELEGHIHRWNQDGSKAPVGRLLVILTDAEGEIVAKRRTAMDGFFLFDTVRPGRYRLILEDAVARELVSAPGEIVVGNQGGVLRNMNFTLRPAAAARQSITPSIPLLEETPLVPR